MERRHFLGFAAAGLATLLPAREADACSLVVSTRTPFSERSCRSALHAFVTLLNEANGLPEDELIRRRDEMNVHLENEWVDEYLGERETNGSLRGYLFVKEFRMSGGRLDPRPIEIEEMNLLRRLGNRATYQFTLKRYSYHPADSEGCNGLFTHDEYYGFDRTSCLATFTANQLKSVSRFPEWYLEE